MEKRSQQQLVYFLHQRPATSTWWCSPLPNGDGSKWQDRSPEGLDRKAAPIVSDCFLLGLPLTGHNWVAPLLLIDRTPFRRLLILALLLISGNVHPNPGPISNHPHPRYPCSICHLDVGRDSLQCSACLKWVHFLCSSLTRADFRTICAAGTAVGWRCPVCLPQNTTDSPTQTSLLVTPPASPPPPPPGFPPLPPGFYQSRPPRGPPRYPCSICFLEVGKDSLKCSTCSKWVHFSCSSLTRADFRKICAAGSPMGWNCPACLNGDLASPTLQPASPRPFSPAPPPPTPPPLACSDLRNSSLPLPSHPPLLNTYPPSAFTLPASSPPPTGSQSVHISPPHTQGNPHPAQNLRILQWNAGGLPSSRRAELIAFLSGNHYDLIFLQETHLSSTKKFQIPGYYSLRTDRTFGRQGPVSSGTHNTGGGVLTLIHSDLAFSPVSVSSLSSRTPTQTTPVLKSFSPTTLLFNFLTSTPLPSETLLLTTAPGPSVLTSFLTPPTLLSSETSMLTTQHGTDSFLLTRSEMTCFAGSLPPVWKFWTTPPRPRSFIIPLGAVLPLISR